MSEETTPKPKSEVRARVVAAVALAALTAAVGGIGNVAYRAATDSFVAPVVLTPASEPVVAGRLKLDELRVDRIRAKADLEETDAEIAALERTIDKLDELRRRASDSLEWTASTSNRQIAAGYAEQRALAQQHKLIAALVERQTAQVEATRANVERGLVGRADLEREIATLDQHKLALLDNERADARGRVALEQLGATAAALRGSHSTPLLPEMVSAREQTVRVELEIARASAELRGRKAQRRVAEERLTRATEAERQLADRPIFRAAEGRIDLAFVPYTQLEGVRPGARVFACTWGLVNCRPVGHITEMVPGEVTQTDPWGHPARGQLAVMALDDASAGTRRTLRVRGGAASPATESNSGDRVSVR